MRLHRIGDKVVSWERLSGAVESIIRDREAGATQEEAARNAGVQRSFVSFLETLGEVRRGPRVALVAFPVANVDEVKELADSHAVDFTLVIRQAQRERIESGSAAADIFNWLLDTIATLRDFDTVVLLASDKRIQTLERILDTEVIGMPLGPSPIREDRVVDLVELDHVLSALMSAPITGDRRPGRVSGVLRSAAEDIAGRWTSSKR